MTRAQPHLLRRASEGTCRGEARFARVPFTDLRTSWGCHSGLSLDAAEGRESFLEGRPKNPFGPFGPVWDLVFGIWSFVSGCALPLPPARATIQPEDRHVLCFDTRCLTGRCRGGVIIRPPGKYIEPRQASFPEGTVVTLTSAAQITGAHFDHWEGDVTGTASPTSVTMDSGRSVTVVFAIPSTTSTFELNTSVAGDGSIAPGSGTFNPGDHIVLVATPDPGSVFVSWSGDTDGCADVPGRPNSLVVVMDRARRIAATSRADETPRATTAS